MPKNTEMERKLKSTDIVDNLRSLGETSYNYLLKRSNMSVAENFKHLSKVKQVFDEVMADDNIGAQTAVAALLQAAIADESKQKIPTQKETFNDKASTSSTNENSMDSGCYSVSDESLTQEKDEDDEENSRVTEPDVRMVVKSFVKIESYKLKNCVLYIFNHYKVASFAEPRKGTQRDVRSLRETFTELKYAVIEFNDLTKDDLFKELRKIADSDLSNVGCVTIAILTHGGSDGNIHAKDLPYTDTQLVDVFRNSANKTLIEKPIHFFIQACRKYPWTPENSTINTHTIPLGPDMLLMHSTYPGNDSYRHEENGSLFIQELCRVILEYRNEEIESILVRVQNNIALKRNETNNDKVTSFRQTPIYTCTLTKEYYFSNIA